MSQETDATRSTAGSAHKRGTGITVPHTPQRPQRASGQQGWWGTAHSHGPQGTTRRKSFLSKPKPLPRTPREASPPWDKGADATDLLTTGRDPVSTVTTLWLCGAVSSSQTSQVSHGQGPGSVPVAEGHCPLFRDSP